MYHKIMDSVRYQEAPNRSMRKGNLLCHSVPSWESMAVSLSLLILVYAKYWGVQLITFLPQNVLFPWPK